MKKPIRQRGSSPTKMSKESQDAIMHQAYSRLREEQGTGWKSTTFN